MSQIAHASVLHRGQLQDQVWHDGGNLIPHVQHYTVGLVNFVKTSLFDNGRVIKNFKV